MTGDVSNLGRQRYLLLISVILVLNMVGCVTGTPSTEPVDVDFVVKVEGKKVPDISRCEMFFWERPRMTGDVPDSHADECIGFSYVGYGCDVLWGAVEATGGRAGVMTHFMIDPKYGREARKYGLYNCTPDNYLEIASNAVVTAGISRVKGRGSPVRIRSGILAEHVRGSQRLGRRRFQGKDGIRCSFVGKVQYVSGIADYSHCA